MAAIREARTSRFSLFSQHRFYDLQRPSSFVSGEEETMSTDNGTPAEKPKRVRRDKAAIIPLPPPVEIRLGSLAVADPKEMIHRAAGLADALAEIIHQQGLY